MKKKRLFLIGLVVFVLATTLSVKLLFASDKILVNFEILNVTNHYTNYEVEFSRVKAADHYVIQIHDSENRKVYEKSTNDVKNTLSLTNLINNHEYSIMVFAYDSLGDYRPCDKEYKFTWDEPTFEEDLSLILNNQDYSLNINGNLENKEYYIKVQDGENTLINEVINTNEYVINKDFYLDQEKELVVTLLSENIIVDEIHLFNNMNPVSDVLITSINNEEIIPFNDITLAYTGETMRVLMKLKYLKIINVLRQVRHQGKR